MDIKVVFQFKNTSSFISHPRIPEEEASVALFWKQRIVVFAEIGGISSPEGHADKT